MYQNGAPAAFGILYQRHSSKIYRFLQTRVSQKEKLADIYQEVFVKIHKSKHLYSKYFPLLPWIFTVTRTVMIDELRKDKDHNTLESVDMITASGVFELNTDSISDSAIALVDNLPNSQKLAIQMRYIDDKTFAEIAQSLNTSSVNVRQIISRGVKKIRELLNEEETNEKSK